MRSCTSLIVAIALTLSVAGNAFAQDNAPCGSPFWNNLARTNVRYCPDWSPDSDGTIPVYRTMDRWIDPAVGFMHSTGKRTNWYICQAEGDNYCQGGYCNTIWAKTYADNGQLGWVSEVYFQGGNDNEADGNLPWCF